MDKSTESIILKTITSLPERFIVDFANGIDITNDHLSVQKKRHVFFNRLADSFTGKGTRRQVEINASLADGVEASLKWLTELTKDLANSHLAIARVNERVSILSQDVTHLAIYSAATRTHLEQLEEQLYLRTDQLSREIERIDFNQRVIMHIEQVFSKWEAGRFRAYSPAASCYVAMEELRWGPFGHYVFTQAGAEKDNFLQQVADKSIVQMARDAQAQTIERLSVYDRWLKKPVANKSALDWEEALNYLGTDFSEKNVPMIATITQNLPDRLGSVPVVATAGRIAEQIVGEIFEGRLYA